MIKKKFYFSHEISKLYPNKYIQLDENRIYVLNTLFNIPGKNIVFYYPALVLFEQSYCI